MAKVIVTGGSGFIGTNVVDYYRARGDQVMNLDRVAPRNSGHHPLWTPVDLLERDALSRVIAEAEPDVVFHLAARTDLLGASIHDYRANTEGVANLLDALHALAKPPFVVFASSMLVCRIGYRPQNELDYCATTAYGESKVEGERLVRERARGFPWIIVRPTSIWGPWFASPYRDFFTAVQRGFYVHPRGMRIRRSYGFVLNSVAQLARVAEAKGGLLVGRTTYLADYAPIELKAWADAIQRELDVRRVAEVPLWMFTAAAAVGDSLKKIGFPRFPMTTFRLKNLLTEMVHDTADLRALCGAQQPYTMEEGVAVTCDWLLRRNQA